MSPLSPFEQIHLLRKALEECACGCSVADPARCRRCEALAMTAVHDDQVYARQIREPDQILMPDGETWCTVEYIRPEIDGRLFMAFCEGGFAILEPLALIRYRRNPTLPEEVVESRND